MKCLTNISWFLTATLWINSISTFQLFDSSCGEYLRLVFHLIYCRFRSHSRVIDFIGNSDGCCRHYNFGDRSRHLDLSPTSSAFQGYHSRVNPMKLWKPTLAPRMKQHLIVFMTQNVTSIKLQVPLLHPEDTSFLILTNQRIIIRIQH